MNELRPTVHAHVGLRAEIPLLALRRLMHLGVLLPVLVLRRTRRGDDRCIDDRAVGDLDPAAPQVFIDCHQQALTEFVLLQQVTELAHPRLIRSAFCPEVDANKAAHRDRVVQRFLHRRVRQVEPELQKVDPQHPLERYRRPTAQLAHLRIKPLDDRNELGPRQHPVHVREELCAPRRLPVLLKPGQRLLLH